MWIRGRAGSTVKRTVPRAISAPGSQQKPRNDLSPIYSWNRVRRSLRTRSRAARPAGPHAGLPPGRPRSPFWPISIRKRLFSAASPPGAPDRRLVSCRIRGEEACGRACRQQHPGGRQVQRRVADEQVAEVDNARQRPVRDDDVRGMQVAVHPHRRPFPCGGRDGVVPDGSDVGGGRANRLGVDGVEEPVEAVSGVLRGARRDRYQPVRRRALLHAAPGEAPPGCRPRAHRG